MGLGTGRFSEPLGIKEGVEPSENMAAIARERGIEVTNGIAENLPIRDLYFDFVLFVTICHLDNLKLAFEHAHRILKSGGSIIIGFIDKNQEIAKSYEKKEKEVPFLNMQPIIL